MFRSGFNMTILAAIFFTTIFLFVPGCPSGSKEMLTAIGKATSTVGCQGCQPEEGEGETGEGEGEAKEGEGEPDEGESEEGEIDGEGENEGEYEGEGILLPGNEFLKVVLIPKGSFTMGRYPDEQGSDSDEDPQHQVTVTEAFWMSKYEVTQAQWRAVMDMNPSRFRGDTLPVEQVSWNDVQDFITTLNTYIEESASEGEREQKPAVVRLPTEAEWEYACRGGTATRFYWGDDPAYTQINAFAWYYVNGGSKTHPVGKKLPNSFGLYDMSGNVWEWCQDWYGTYPNGPTTNPPGPVSGSLRILRGGSYRSTVDICRSAYRAEYAPHTSILDIGFRVVVSFDLPEDKNNG